MKYTQLGSMKLQASVLGLGTGGPSRVGKRTGKVLNESVEIIRAGLDRGVNFIDSAEAYDTENIVGEAVKGRDRSSLILCTKTHIWQDTEKGDIRPRIEASLKNLGTDYIDVYLLHAVTPAHYRTAYDRYIPQLENARDAGLIRFLGVSEMFMEDPGHEMFSLALKDDAWDIFMVGFNLLNQTAGDRVLTGTRQKGIGTLDMFAVRRVLSDVYRRREVFGELISDGLLDKSDLSSFSEESGDPLGFLLEETDAETIPEASYRFCLEEPGIDVVLSGTGSMEHLLENISAADKPPLPSEVTGRLRRIFSRVDTVSGH